MNIEDIKDLKDKIELLSKSQQIDVGRILKKHNVALDENKNGVFVNLSLIDDNILCELKKYLTYANKQELQLKNIEIKQEELKDFYFNNTNETKHQST